MNKTHNIDWLELTFNYNPTFITNLITKELDLIVKTTYKNNKPTYYVNDLFSIFILEPNGAVEGRTYIKIENPKLYESLTATIELLKQLSYKYNIELLYLNQLDITTDFIGIDLLQQIDLNKLNEYKAASKIYLKAITNEQGGKTLYFNTIDIDKYIGKKQKKQRANGKLYTKSIELEIKKNKYKQSYQNPTNELITRLELSFKKDFIVAKETHLLKAMADFIWTNPQKLISEKDYIIQYIFQEYEHLYYLENNGIIILDFNTIFNDHNELYDYGHITDLIDLYKGNTDNYKIKMTKYRKTYNKPIFNKKLYLESIEANITLWQNEYKEFMTGPIIEKLLKNTGTTHHHQLDIVRIKEDKETNGENLHMLIHNHIYSYLQNNPITETYEVMAESIEDLFN
jgi:hypothetical protein